MGFYGLSNKKMSWNFRISDEKGGFIGFMINHKISKSVEWVYKTYDSFFFVNMICPFRISKQCDQKKNSEIFFFDIMWLLFTPNVTGGGGYQKCPEYPTFLKPLRPRFSRPTIILIQKIRYQLNDFLLIPCILHQI